MKKIGFIGAFDKMDFILYVAKMLTALNNKVLIVDSTVNQKAKYIVPVINPTKSYITEFEGIDVAVGFYSFEQINNYLLNPEETQLGYDIILLDIDSAEAFENFVMYDAELNYFVTSFDLFSLKKGLEILSGLRTEVEMIKILFSKTMSKEEDDYLNFLSMTFKIKWNEDKIYFPFEMGDQTVIISNQRVSKIKYKNLTQQYKDGILIITSQITKIDNLNELRKTLKSIEKGV